VVPPGKEVECLTDTLKDHFGSVKAPAQQVNLELS
jgi:hypothetical protein